MQIYHINYEEKETTIPFGYGGHLKVPRHTNGVGVELLNDSKRVRVYYYGLGEDGTPQMINEKRDFSLDVLTEIEHALIKKATKVTSYEKPDHTR